MYDRIADLQAGRALEKVWNFALIMNQPFVPPSDKRNSRSRTHSAVARKTNQPTMRSMRFKRVRNCGVKS